jgi:hypothetical protein
MKRIKISLYIIVSCFCFNANAQLTQILNKDWGLFKSDLSGIWEAVCAEKAGNLSGC